ncbi:MAG: hypothetical protein QXR32_07320 [Candidatus Caldarchaeum sp.]
MSSLELIRYPAGCLGASSSFRGFQLHGEAFRMLRALRSRRLT